MPSSVREGDRERGRERERARKREGKGERASEHVCMRAFETSMRMHICVEVDISSMPWCIMLCMCICVSAYP